MSDVPEGYRMSGVGVIPEDWAVKTIGDFTSSTAGGTPSTLVPEYWNGDIRWMSSGELNLKKIHEVEGRITEAGLKNSSTKIVPLKCILIGLAGQGKTRGTTAINYVELCTNQSIAAIFPNDSFIPEYLFYNIDSRYKELRNLSTGDGGRGGLNLKIIKGILVPLPTKTEQQAIASTLSDVDALITALEQLITKKRNIKQGAMQQLLTGEKRLPGFSGEWEANSIESLTPLNKKYGIVDGPFGSNLKTIHYRKSGIPIITSGYVTEGIFIATDYLYVDIEKFKQEKRSAVYGGDIVMAKIGARCGASAILPINHEKGLLSGNALKITVDETKHSTYLIWQILWSIYTTGEIETLKSVGAQPAISMPNLKKFQITLPPLPEQQAIAQILSDMDTEIESLEQKRDKYKSIKQGMMQELLTGKMRLV